MSDETPTPEAPKPTVTRVVISTSEARNVQQVVYHNVDENGKKSSITRFEPLNPDKAAKKRVFPKAPR